MRRIRHLWGVCSLVVLLIGGAIGRRWLLKQPSPAVVQQQVQQQLWAQVNEAAPPVPQIHAAGIAALQHGANASAARSFRAALEYAPTLALPWYHLGVAYTNMGQQQDALTALRQATDLEPRFATAWLNIGLLQLERNDLQAAKDALNQAISLDPNFELARLSLARAYLKGGDAAAAERVAREAVRRAPRSAPAWLALGDMLAEAPAAPSSAEAMRCFERAVQLSPDAYGNFRLGQMALRLNRTQVALVALARATILDPSNPTSWYLLARAQALAGRPEADQTLAHARRVHALAHQTKVLNLALAQQPQNARLYFQLGAVEARLGQREAALQAYQHGLGLAPTDSAARRALESLETAATP